MNFSTLAVLQARTSERSNILGRATLNFGGVLVINDIIISNSATGPFVQFPSYKTKEGEYKSICNPHSKDAHQVITTAIMESYRKAMAGESSAMVTIGDAAATPHFTIRTTPYETEGSNLKGYATVTLDDGFDVGSITLRENINGNLYVLFPGNQLSDRKDAAGNPIRRFICELPNPGFESKLVGSIIKTFKASLAAAAQA